MIKGFKCKDAARVLTDLLWRYGPSGPRLVNWVLHLSSLRARNSLKGAKPITVLIDNSVLGHGTTHETVEHLQRINWPPGSEASEVPVICRVPIDIKQRYNPEVYGSVQYLPGIVHLTRLGLIQLKSSFELFSERNHQPMGRYRGKKGWFDYFLFEGIKIKSVDGYPLPNFEDQKFFTKNPTINKVICSSDKDPLQMYPNNEQTQLKRMAQATDPLHKKLVGLLGKRNTKDAWHICTAESHGMFCFLTMDFKLCTIIKQTKNNELTASLITRVMTPEEFGKYIGLLPINPYICELAERDLSKKSPYRKFNQL